MIFENTQTRPEDLPKVENIEFQPLAPAYRQVEYISRSIFWGVVLFGWLIFLLLNIRNITWLNWALLGAWALFYGTSMYAAGRRYANAGYALRERDITHKEGVIFKTVTTIPFNRMQHSEISRGPVESSFGLATLRVFTAGGSSSDMAIPGLLFEEAQRIKEYITSKISDKNGQEGLTEIGTQRQ